MPLSITTTHAELSISRQYIFASIFGLEVFTSFGCLEGSPMWEASRWEVGSGCRFIAGPFLIDIGKAETRVITRVSTGMDG